ncbi:MAG: CRTAC1 family protein [Planctomycetota bacterium]|nr:CRTAC1 family protein [Planctomycetota bacterium]
MRLVACSAALLFLPAVFGLAAEQDLPTFTDVTEQAGIHFKHSFGDVELKNIVQGTGSGAMFFDYDGDGWLDIYLVCGRWNQDISSNRSRHLRGKLSNKLYHNNRDGTFTDVTEKAGVAGQHFASGVSAADYDGDGNIDLLVLCYGHNELYHNNGDGTFTDVTEQSGLARETRWSLAAGWFDYNNDGRLDVYVVNYLKYDPNFIPPYYAPQGYPGPLSYPGEPDALFRNNGDGTFTDVTKEAGMWNPDGRGMSMAIADLNNDGLLDVYVTNDAMASNLYVNLGNGKFEDQGLLWGLAFGEGGQGVSSMGPIVGDVDRDGLWDVFVPAMHYGSLHMNRGQFFEDKTANAGLTLIVSQYTGWGAVFFDYDNDGYLDFFQANGDAHHEYPEEAVLCRNNGKGQFIDVARQSGDYFHHKYVGRGAAFGDFNNDGNVDLLVANLNDSPRLLRNNGSQKHNWLTIVAKLPNGRSDAVGSLVTVTTGSLKQKAYVGLAQGYLSQSDPRSHFGLGKAKQADRVEIRWSNGRVTELKDVAANQFLQVVQPAK